MYGLSMGPVDHKRTMLRTRKDDQGLQQDYCHLVSKPNGDATDTKWQRRTEDNEK
jgi:hypothetical protein